MFSAFGIQIFNLFYSVDMLKIASSKSYADKLNFWDKCLDSLINISVGQRCYNLVGTKTAKTSEFVVNLKNQLEYKDAAVSTIIEILTKAILPLSLTLATLYEEAADKHFSVSSPEYKNRVKFDFVRDEGVSWKDDDIYQGVIIFPEVSVLAQDILKEQFKFTKAQIQAMDPPNDQDGRGALRWCTLLTCLVINLGFGELSFPSQTLAGKASDAKLQKSSSAQEQNIGSDNGGLTLTISVFKPFKPFLLSI